MSGSSNIGIGQATQEKVSTGSYNISLGSEALRYNSTGSNNVAIGQYAYGANALGTTGSENTAVGFNAMNVAGNASYSTALGQGALYRVTGNNNTGIGTGAGNTTTSGTNNTFLGFDAEGSNATVSNEITLGNTAVTKFRIPGIDFVLKDNGGTPTTGQVLTADGSGEGYWATPSGSGDVVGPASSTDNAIVRFDSTTGKLLQNSTVTLSDAGAIAAASLTLTTDLAVADGGTGAGTFAANGILYGNGTGAIGTAVGTATHVLTSNGPGVAPTFQAAGGGATDIDGLSDALTNSSGGTIGLGTGALTNDDGSANNNTALGYNALNLATTAAFNVAVGYQAMDSMTTGFGYSTAVGYQALGGATTGYGNTALGHTALSGVISGNNNTAIGRGAGSSVTDSSCVIIGHDAGRKAGEGSISIGADSLTSLSLAASAVAVGQNTLKALTTGAGNTAVGQDGLILTTTGAQNTSLGKSAGYRITTGTGNTMIGSDAGAAAGPATTNYNTFVGYYSGRFAPGANNTLIGYKAGYGVSGSTTTNAEYMVAVGEHALTGITTGQENTAVGGYAGSSTTSGYRNTYLGYGAGDALTTGSNNTIIGNGSDASSATVSNEITLGNASIATLRCQVTSITALSDRRDKKDIVPLELGLDFINSLNPVKFTWNTRDGAKVGQQEAGFIAQELDEAQIAAGAETYLDIVLKENLDKLEAAPGKLIPVLVKAIQDLSAEVAALKEQING
jgi:trimeric autotransporter adhesin